MNRAEVIRRLMPRSQDTAYLEIGVQHGHTFHAVEAGIKIAVDPCFGFDVATAENDPVNAKCKYHQITSNEYFSRVWSPEDRFDVIFIDGLHTFDQTLKDLLNAMRCVKSDGIIIVDDVMPVSYASSISNFDHFTRFREKSAIADGSWMGDVFKIPFFVKHYIPSHTYATVSENCAQMVIWPSDQRIDNDATPSVETICKLSYSDFVLESDILNLAPIVDIERRLYESRKR